MLTTSGSSRRRSAHRASTPSPTARSRSTSTPRCSGVRGGYAAGNAGCKAGCMAEAAGGGCAHTLRVRPTHQSSTACPVCLCLQEPDQPRARPAAAPAPGQPKAARGGLRQRPDCEQPPFVHSFFACLTHPHSAPCSLPAPPLQVVNLPVYDGPEARYCPAGAPQPGRLGGLALAWSGGMSGSWAVNSKPLARPP